MMQPEQGEMPLDKFYKEKSIFSGENPYSPQGDMVAPEMGQETMLKQVTSPNVDFTKNTLAEQMPQKTVEGQMLGSGADALLAFGDPSMKALGLGLKTVQGISDAKQQQKMNKYKAEVARIQARQEALNRLSQIGQGLRA